jgi:hypothetical protein
VQGRFVRPVQRIDSNISSNLTSEEERTRSNCQRSCKSSRTFLRISYWVGREKGQLGHQVVPHLLVTRRCTARVALSQRSSCSILRKAMLQQSSCPKRLCTGHLITSSASASAKESVIASRHVRLIGRRGNHPSHQKMTMLAGEGQLSLDEDFIVWSSASERYWDLTYCGPRVVSGPIESR